MTHFSSLVPQINYELRGIDDDAPNSGSEEYSYWLSISNRLIRTLYRNVGKKWRMGFKEVAPKEAGTVATTASTTLTGTDTYFTDYAVGDKITVSGETERTIASITSDTSLTVSVAFSTTASTQTFTRSIIIADGVQSYNLHRSFLGASSTARITKTDGQVVYLNIVSPEEASPQLREVYIAGDKPETLTVTNTIASTDDIVGGVLSVPGYYIPDDMTGDTSVVYVPDTDWLALAAAAEIAFGDITYEDKSTDLLGKANSSYRHMAINNRRGTYGQPKQSPVKVRRIRSV